MDIPTIIENLKVGQNSPAWLAEAKDWLAGHSSSLMDRQIELQKIYASYFILERTEVKSDRAVLMLWRTSISGQEELNLENEQRKIKVLREAISSHLRVHDNQARNLY